MTFNQIFIPLAITFEPAPRLNLKHLNMKKTIFLALTVLAALSAFAQSPAITPPAYSADSFRLQSSGPRIFLYSFCPPYATPGRATYFRKDQDSVIHRLTIRNLRVALADNPASMQQLHIAGVNVGIGIGLLAGGIALTTAGIISTIHKNNEASNAYNQASAKWFQQAQTNPNTPMPTLPHYSASPLIYIGAATTLSCMIPLFNVASHGKKAIDIYNGID
jgi:hypothetical protein